MWKAHFIHNFSSGLSYVCVCARTELCTISSPPAPSDGGVYARTMLCTNLLPQMSDDGGMCERTMLFIPFQPLPLTMLPPPTALAYLTLSHIQCDSELIVHTVSAS